MANKSGWLHGGAESRSERFSSISKVQVITCLFMFFALMVTAVIVGRLEAREAPPAEARTPAPGPAAAPGPDDAVAAEVKELKSRLDDLTKSAALVVSLSEKVSRIDHSFGDVARQIEGLGTEVLALKKEIGSISAAMAPNPNDASKASADTHTSELVMNEAIDLFKKAKYKDALDRFRKLIEADDKDARSWYYAAIASGLVTRNWTSGDAVAYVRKGVELEKAGSPGRDQIDALVNALSPQTGKDWLTYYRRSAR
jgi:hypothetical protein